MKTPCKDCTSRKPGCHGKCDVYITWKKNYEKRRDEQRIKDRGNPFSAAGWIQTVDGYWRNTYRDRRRK